MAHRVPFWLFGVFAGIPADRADRKLVSTTAHYARFFLSLSIFGFYFSMPYDLGS